MRSAMLVPMRVRDRVLGAISFCRAESGRASTQHDLALAEDLALRAARRSRTRGCTATALDDRADAAGVAAAAGAAGDPGRRRRRAYRPAGEGLEVGGDFYDVFATAEGQWYVVIGDVCGKGAEAAAVTALARYTIRAAAARRRSPARDPALGRRGDARSEDADALLHDRLRAPRPLRRPRA